MWWCSVAPVLRPPIGDVRPPDGLLAALGLRLDIDRGADASGAVDGGAAGGLIVANHISFLDILAVAAVSPAHFVAKSEVIAWPVIGRVTRSIGVIGLRRESLRGLPAAVDAVRADLAAGDSVGVFPEGTTWCGRGGGRFRPAFFQAAIDAQVPVRPMVVSFHTSTGGVSTRTLLHRRRRASGTRCDG